MSKRFPGRRLSWFRLVVLVVAVVALGTAGTLSVFSLQDEWRADKSHPWYAAYVDVTAGDSYAFETVTKPDQKSVVLAFIVAQSASECEPSWGTHYTLDKAESEIDLDRRIARFTRAGGQVVVSFGGQANTELALACDSSSALAAQYRAVIDRYKLAVIDLDIEGGALKDEASITRRAEAVASIQKQEREAHKAPTQVWLTLPVGEDGLPPEAVKVIDAMLGKGVVLAGVNAMTMDFASAGGVEDQGDASIAALTRTHQQLMAIYADRQQELGSATAWRMVGATPMIGQNDVPGEVFTLADAKELNRFASKTGLGRLSMWSANRDMTCSAAYADWSLVSDSCSGVEQGAERYGAVLSKGFDGLPSDIAQPSAGPTAPVNLKDLKDDPATSPYPIWSASSSYPADTRIVWRHNVYVAKWWTSGDRPDDPVRRSSDNPWRLIGPVLPGEKPIPEPTLPPHYYPKWSGTTIYTAPQRVMLDGIAYEAKWWTQGDNPAAGQVDPGTSPWRRLTRQEITELLNGD